VLDNTISASVIDAAVRAHGGRDRWLAVRSLTAPVSIGGSLWSDKGHDGALADAAVYIDPHRQHVEFSGFGPRRLRTWFEPGLVSVRTEDGTEIDRRRDPPGVVSAGRCSSMGQHPGCVLRKLCDLELPHAPASANNARDPNRRA
jgi:hypothetical protein